MGFSAFQWVTFVYVQNPPSGEAETPHSKFHSPDVAVLFSSTGKVASTGIPLCHLFWCLDLNSRKGKDGQQEILMCLVTVGVADGELRLLGSGTRPSGGRGPPVPGGAAELPFPGTSTSVSLYSSYFSSLPGNKSGSSTVVSSIKLNK